MQERYGQGHIDSNEGAVYSATDGSSWGPVLDGSMKEAWNGETYAYSKYGDKLKDYFETGFHRIITYLSAMARKNLIIVLHSVLQIMTVYSRTRS